MRHLLVTNDFPPKLGGIQSYLYELWRRLDPDETAVLTTPHSGDAAFDSAQPFSIVRDRDRVLLPHRGLIGRIEEHARRHRADLVVLDPVLPLGWVGPKLKLPYAVVVHGAELTVPARVAPIRAAMARVLRGARLVIAAGPFPAGEAERIAECDLPIDVIPPGVDTARFTVPTQAERETTRSRFGVTGDGPVVVSISRLVPRKGMDVLIEASARLAAEFPGLTVLIGGTGRDRGRLERIIERTGAPARLVGRIDEEQLAGFVAMGDVFAMCCRNRWFGLEQEGFGIVFLEAASAGVPQLAGSSGGASDAVQHGSTGFVVGNPSSVGEVTSWLRRLLIDPMLRADLAAVSRRRAVADYDYDRLAGQLGRALAKCVGPESGDKTHGS